MATATGKARSDERVAERQGCGGLVGPHEPGPFGRFEALSFAADGERPDQAQIARAVQGGQEQQVIGRGWQGLDAGPLTLVTDSSVMADDQFMTSAACQTTGHVKR